MANRPRPSRSSGVRTPSPPPTWQPVGVEDPKAWLALAHPIRIRLLYQLQHHDRARATDLAQAVGVPVNSASFHLRQLARFGYVVSAPGEDDARERWWRTTSPDGFRIGAEERDDARRAARSVLQPQMKALAHEMIEAWFESNDNDVDPPAKRSNFDVVMDLTNAEIERMQREIGGVLRRWSVLGREHTATGNLKGRRPYQVIGFAAHCGVIEPWLRKSFATAASSPTADTGAATMPRGQPAARPAARRGGGR